MGYSESYNPYVVLGIPNGSSLALVKATYKSLVKIFHPDVFDGDKQFAVDRLSALNEAYEFLSDPSRKRKLDERLSADDNADSNGAYDPEHGNEEFSKASENLKEKWDFACEYHPEIIAYHQSLKLLDRNSADLFVFVIVEEQQFSKAGVIADEIEARFLSSKFGNDREICALAKLAIINKKNKFAKQLNQALKILGEGSKENIFLKLAIDHPDFAIVAFPKIGRKDIIKNVEPKTREQVDPFWEDEFDRAIQTGNVSKMKNQLEKFGYTCVEDESNKSGNICRPEINGDKFVQFYKSNFELMQIMAFEKRIIRRFIVKT